jgi:Protein of unknown function (DUF2510)
MPEGSPGWYPDPAGTPGRYRYWDGSQWSALTTADPQQSAPTDGDATDTPRPAVDSGPPSQPSRRRRLALIMGVLAVVVTAAVAVAMAVGNFRPVMDTPSATSTNLPDTRSATPTKVPPQPGPALPTTATPVPLRCPKGNPNRRASHPSDGRVHGGNLSFAEQPTLEPAALESRFTFAYDVIQQAVIVSPDPPWLAQLAVGRLRRKDGFVGDPRSTVESLVRCVITGNMYSPYLPTRTDIRSEGLSIDGHSGWLVDSEITVDRPDLRLAGDHTIFIVVRDGKDWGFFFGAVPIGNAQLDAVLATTIRGLRAS